MEWVTLFKHLQHWMTQNNRTKGAYVAVARDPKLNPQRVNRRTLQRRFEAWIDQGAPDEYELNETRGGHNRAFAVSEEREMACEIMTSFLDNAQGWTGEDFKLVAIERHQSLIRNKVRSARPFKATGRFISRFMKAWGFTLKTPQLSRVAKNPFAAEQTEVFLMLCARWRDLVEDRDFWNFDETFWRLVQGALLAWGRVGVPCRIKTMADLKRGITLGFAINLAGGKLPIQLIKKGSTQRALDSLKLDRFQNLGCSVLNFVCLFVIGMRFDGVQCSSDLKKNHFHCCLEYVHAHAQ